MNSVEPFSGFSRAAVDFLADLATHNERPWFQARKGEYERLLKRPMQALCVAMSERFEARGLQLRSDPIRSPYRIYRDVRFSADKSPYHDHVAAAFPWNGEGGGVGGYFIFRPGGMFASGGMWHPEPARLASWRRMVSEDYARLRAILDEPEFVATYGQPTGARLKRMPAGFPADHPGAELLKLTDVIFNRRLSDEEVFSADLPDILVSAYVPALPLLGLLATLSPVESGSGWLRNG